MRIARLLTRLNLGGPARQALASDPILLGRGHEIRLFTGKPEAGEGDLFETFRARGLDVVRIPGLQRGISPARDLIAMRRIRRELASYQPDVVHTHASKAGTLGRQALAKIRGFQAVGRVHTFHGHVLEGYFPNVVSKRLTSLERKLARTTDRILAVSHATADDLVRLDVVGEDKLVVVPPGIELGSLLGIRRAPAPGVGRPVGDLRRLVGATKDNILVGVVGRLAEVKRLGWAVDVFELLRNRYPDFHMVFVGDGTERRMLERRIESLPESARARIHLVGARTDMTEVWRELNIALLTSRSEGMPVSLIEAGASGVPAVAARVGGVEELVVHERTGLLGASVEELGFGLAQLMDNPSERVAMGERARLRVARHHTAQRLADRLEKVYRVVCAERQGDARVLKDETGGTS